MGRSALEIAQHLHREGKLREAVDAYRRVLVEDAHHSTAHAGLGFILHQQNELTASEGHFREALAHGADRPLVLASLASNVLDQGRVEEATTLITEAATLRPELSDIQSNRLLFSLYDYRINADQRYALHREWGRIHGAGKAARREGGTAAARVRVGYLSGDFRNHPVAFFVEPLLRWHDRAQFEVIGYSDVEKGDEFTERLRGLAERWVVTRGMPDEELARRMRDDGVDVLVELAGHSAGNRLGVVRRMLENGTAVVSYIGYPGTMGLVGGYRFSDALLDPAGEEGLYTETTLRLPAFWCYQAPPGVGGGGVVGPLPAAGGGNVTFGSFNYLGKINSRVIAVWARILQRVANSRLVLKAKALDDAGVRERVRSAFAAEGIDGSRLELQGATPFQQYMADFAQIDLCLDPFPFNGGTTTFHSFYMGVPIVALEGRGHAERMGAALLRHVGLPEFVARDVEEYVEIAVRAAGDLGHLAEIRARLRERMKRSPLMDGAGQTRAIEACYRQMLGIAEPADRGASAKRDIRVERSVFSSGGKPAFSAIVCGREPRKRERMAAQVEKLLGGRGAELLYVENPPSLAAGYNAALREAAGDMVLFMHDDIDILSADLAERLQKHLATYELLGVAGTSRLVDGAWGHAGQPFLFGQVVHPAAGGYSLCAFGGAGPVFGNIQGLDGLFIAARLPMAREIGFDEQTFDGFHLYDLDFSFRAHLAGYRVAVANDIFILHHSRGTFDQVWRSYYDRFVRKFAGKLAAPPIKRSDWFSRNTYRTEAELLAKMRRNAFLGGGFSY